MKETHFLPFFCACCRPTNCQGRGAKICGVSGSGDESLASKRGTKCTQKRPCPEMHGFCNFAVFVDEKGRALEPWAVQNIQKDKKVVECRLKNTVVNPPGRATEGDTMPFAVAAGACVWGPDCQVPLTHGHWCTRCELPAHTACTFKNVMEFATRHRGTGADGERGERQYARAVETVAGAGVPCCARTGTRDRCGRAALCAHGRAMPVTRLRARRLSRADALGSC